jgi:hypothetical protein
METKRIVNQGAESFLDEEIKVLDKGHIIFESFTEAQSSIDPVKLRRAVEKLAAETRREIDLGFASGSYACAMCAAHYANRLARLLKRSSRLRPAA